MGSPIRRIPDGGTLADAGQERVRKPFRCETALLRCSIEGRISARIGFRRESTPVRRSAWLRGTTVVAGEDRAMTMVRVLGPVDVIDAAGETRAPATPIRRTILTLLALSDGRPVSGDRLLDLAWDEDSPASGVRALLFHVSRLREEIGTELIETVTGGYRLDADVDVSDVNNALHDGVNDVAGLESVLGRWRGEPFADTRPCTALDHERQRVTESWLVLSERLYACRVEQGEGPGSVGDLTALCLEHPHREGLASSLARAQYQAGDQAAALRTIERLRVRLLEDMGLDPSPAVVDLEREILTHGEDLVGSAGGLPGGTLTFLFTDVEGSTRLWGEHSEAMGSALATHDEILRDRIERRRGFVFTTAGDSFAAAFETAGDALAAASEAQSALSEQAWPEGARIRVRMGLHTGVAECRGDDFFGPDVNRAARIGGAAHGGQILLSPTTVALTRHDGLRPVGGYRFRGFDDEIELHQLGDEVFPPIRAGARRRSNVPRVDEALIGRDADLQQLMSLVDEHRVVTITGTGGIGKTSLAKALGHQLSMREAQEVWWCDLVAVDSDEVPGAVGRAVGLTSGAGGGASIAAAVALRGPTWLFLDNCEHVVDGVADIVVSLLSGCDVRIVTTSRVPVEVGGEVLFALPALDPETSAVELFLRKAERVSDVSFDASDASTLHSICSRLDGIPLALELVAARTRAISLGDIEKRLESLLSSEVGRGHAGNRHATMSAAISWSVDLLDPAIRPGLGALAVFPAAFDLESAEAILGREIEDDPLDAIETFVTHSMIAVERNAGGTLRYRMLEPVRQYAARHLWADPDATRDRHLDYFLARLESAYELLGTSTCFPLLEVLEHDLADLGRVHEWALASGRIDDDLRLYRPMYTSWLHSRTEPSDWAMATAQIDSVEGRPNWGACLTLARTGMIGKVQPDVLIDQMRRHSSISPDDPTIELARHGIAAMNGLFLQIDWDAALRTYEDWTSDETSVLFSRYFFGSQNLAMAAEVAGKIPIDEAVDQCIQILDAGLSWARSVNARNFEAAFLQASANILTRNGRLDDALRAASQAESLSVSLGMVANANLASYHQVCAAIMGAEIEGDPLTRLVRILESCVLQDVHFLTIAYAAQPAARLLAAAGLYETAALCMLQPTVGFPDFLPRLGVDDIPEAAWAAAEEANAGTTLLAVGARVLNDLKRLT